MMIPITRKEKYINEIVGGGNTAPETPQTREELFFAEILGEVVAPSPITRAEKYLAKIANKYNGELPEPVTRIEFFIARAAGMDVTIPTPITREEMLWANYALIVEKELSGIPPLTFNAIAGTLSNYRIYGNTVSGESVGDRTGNLFDGEVELGSWNINTQPCSKIVTNTRMRNANFIKVDENSTYSITLSSKKNVSLLIHFLDAQCNYIRETTWQNDILIFNTPSQCEYINIIFKKGNNEVMALSDIFNIMLNAGSTPLPYEPYGYRVPVTVTNGTDTQTTNIYLPEPLTKSGDNADYIDYAAQKRHNSDGTESSVTLPEISTFAGTNTLSVGTTVQPSEVYIKYEGAQ